MDKKICDLCPLSHLERPSATITTCIWPLLNVERQRTNQPFCRKIEPIKTVRFKQPANMQKVYGPWTNLTYRPIIQGALQYRGVYKLVPIEPPPSTPVLCRPAPVRPTDFRGITVYCRRR